MNDKRRVIAWQFWIERHNSPTRERWRSVARGLPLALTTAFAWHVSRVYMGGRERGWRAVVAWLVFHALRLRVALVRTK